jgi:hypothetical protein
MSREASFVEVVRHRSLVATASKESEEETLVQPGVPQRRADLNIPRSALFILDAPEACTRIHMNGESVNMAMRLAKPLGDDALITIPTQKLRTNTKAPTVAGASWCLLWGLRTTTSAGRASGRHSHHWNDRCAAAPRSP